MTAESGHQQDFLGYLRILWRWKLLFAAFLVIPPVAIYFVERSRPKIFESSALVELQASATGASAAIGTPAAVTQQEAAAVARLVSTPVVATSAARILGPPAASPTVLLNEIGASVDPNTELITISARNHDPRRAADIANAFASAIDAERVKAVSAQLTLQIHALQRQLVALPVKDQVDRNLIQQQIAGLRGQRATQSGDAFVAQPAVVTSAPVSPDVTRSVILALVIGLLLGIGAVLIAETSDRRVRTPEALEAATASPLLTSIPQSVFKSKLAHGHDAESIQMLRAALGYLNAESPLKSVAIVSPQAGEGKTTIAVGLALAAARAGRRVVLLEADMRRPQIGATLGLGSAPGLSDVLSGELSLPDALREYPVETSRGGTLAVLLGGTPPPNPSALISSQQMERLVWDAGALSDLVIIDTPASLVVSDTVPLFRIASGVVLIARMGRSSKAAIHRLQAIINSAHGRLLGVVAAGTTPVRGYGTGYGYYGRDTSPSSANGRAGGVEKTQLSGQQSDLAAS